MQHTAPSNASNPETVTGQEHYIVAIGASAGGLEAIHEFFDNMPANGNLSFVIIQHLSPDYKSLLVELVAKHTTMQVFEAREGMDLEKSCIYVIPNNKLLTIKDCKLNLSDKHFEKAPNTAIDTFLKSLAADQGAKAIAVILSGTGSDGSKGIEAIQKAGGMVLVQDPISAKFDGMPNTAIASGHADYILTPELMPEEIFNYIHEQLVPIQGEDKPDESYLPEVLKLVEKNCHHDFTNYKAPTLLRRIGRRMAQLGHKKFTDYLDFLRSNADECQTLGKEFLIGVTKFFRDRAAFDCIQHDVLDEIVSRKKNGENIKVWVVACSTGEEAYSIAIAVEEAMREAGKDLDIKIFATDIDVEAVEFASKGIYPRQALAEVDSALVKRYFLEMDGKVQVLPELRKKIVFARHNVLKDPPFIKNDLVTCRNMLIYMNSILQRKVLGTLQFSLNTNGYLFLGPSEIPAAAKESFQEVNSKWKIYRKTGIEPAYNPERFPSTQSYRNRPDIMFGKVRENSIAKGLAEDFKKIFTEEYGFAAVYIDRNFEVKEGIGNYKKYLSLPQDSMHLQLTKMAGPELSLAISTAVRKAMKENTVVNLHHVRVKENGQEKSINIFVKPALHEGLFIVAFSEAQHLPAKSNTEFVPQNPTESAAYIAELEDELKDMRSNLQMAIESLETANEELQSSNEELLSANEELQSSNEELQSLNEELHTLNTEHQLRIKELQELNDDLNNYFRSSEIAQIFVDGDFRIRKFNPVAVEMVNLISSDIGRPIEHISTNIREQNLSVDIALVMEGKPVVEKEVQLANGRTMLMKIIPYVRQDKNIDGVVITFIDVSSIKELNAIVKGVFNGSVSALMALRSVKDSEGEIADFRWMAANYASDALLKMPTSRYLEKSVKKNLPQLLQGSLMSELVKVAETGTPLHKEISLQVDGNAIWYDLIATQIDNGIALNLTNIDEKKKAEERFRKNYEDLMKAKEDYRKLSMALEEKVDERTAALSESEERFRQITNATSDAVWDWNLVNGKIWWSDTFYSLFGFERTQETENVNFWLQHVHPKDKEKVKQEWDSAKEGLTDNWESRFRLRKTDGEFATIFNKGAVLKDENDKPYRMVGAMTDITGAEQSERLLKQKNDELQSLIQDFKFVTDFIPQMVWATRPDGYHYFYNAGWYNYTGLSYEETKNKGWSLVLHPDDYGRTWAIWKDCLATGKKYEAEYRMRCHDGTYRWFLARAIPLKDDKGNILKWFGTCTDIHDQKMMTDLLEQKVKERTEALQKSNVELETSNSELLQFASVASHDLKEPLRKIHMFSNLIKERYMKDADKSAISYMERIITASARMTKLINDLLSFTRLSESSAFEKIELNRIVTEVLSDLELVISEKKAKVEVAKLPAAEIVSGQMRQVFQNIISNALKFAKKDEVPHIRIMGERVTSCDIDATADAKGECCRITISDNGIGFDNSYADKIFTIFQRLHGRDAYDGTGIGLAITRKIIEKHNGSIMAHSKENEGATFTIVLPLKQPTDLQRR